MPAKFFPTPMPYGASPAANVLNPTQPAAQNAQQPLLPPNFQDPGKMQAQTVAQNTLPAPINNPVGGAGPQRFGRQGNPFDPRIFSQGLF